MSPPNNSTQELGLPPHPHGADEKALPRCQTFIQAIGTELMFMAAPGYAKVPARVRVYDQELLRRRSLQGCVYSHWG